MASILVLSNGKKLDVDRFWVDQGKSPVMGMMGGQKTIFEKGTAPKPSIFQRGEGFFTLDGAPITEAVAAPWLEDPDFPESLKGPFRAFLAKMKTGQKPKERPTKVRQRKAEPKEKRVLTNEDMGLARAELALVQRDVERVYALAEAAAELRMLFPHNERNLVVGPVELEA